MLNLIIFGAVFIGVAAMAAAIGSLVLRREEATSAESRLDMLTGGAISSAASTLNRRNESLLGSFEESENPIVKYFADKFNLARYLDQGNVQMSPAKFLLMTGILGVGGTLVAPIVRIPLAFAPLLGISLAFLPFLYAWWKRGSRLAKFATQLPEGLELISRALRAGHSLASGISLVAEESNDPLGGEFARVYEAQNLGRPIEEALEEMAQRVPNLDLRFFVTAVVLQRQTGGDLAEILDKIGHLVRERFKIFGQIQALTGEGRLSGVVLLGLPPVLAVVMYRLNPGYLMMLFTDPMGQQMLAVAVVMQILGAFVIKKIIDIKV